MVQVLKDFIVFEKDVIDNVYEILGDVLEGLEYEGNPAAKPVKKLIDLIYKNGTLQKHLVDSNE